jgi:hypothetical protein
MVIEYTFNNATNPTELYLDIGKVQLDNDGIGGYEFWGSQGYDGGTDYISEITIDTVMAMTPDGRLVKIHNRFYDDIAEYCLNNSSIQATLNEEYTEG